MAGRTTKSAAELRRDAAASVATLDLNAVMAEAADEDTRPPFAFDFGADRFVLPRELDVRVVGLLKEGDLLGALERLLGPDQYATLMVSPTVLGVTAMKVLLESYGAWLGVSLGE